MFKSYAQTVLPLQPYSLMSPSPYLTALSMMHSADTAYPIRPQCVLVAGGRP